MMLEIQLGEAVIVRYDDCMEDVRPVPEQVEDYLNRMRRTALKIYKRMPDIEPASVADDLGEQS